MYERMQQIQKAGKKEKWDFELELLSAHWLKEGYQMYCRSNVWSLSQSDPQGKLFEHLYWFLRHRNMNKCIDDGHV